MTKQQVKTGLAARLGRKLAEAVRNHQADPVSLGGGGDLPAGIEGGIAQLNTCEFRQVKSGPDTGKDCWYADGVVVAPTTFNGTPIEGLRTQCMVRGMGIIPLYDTKRRDGTIVTLDEHVADLLNELKKLGVEMDGSFTEEDLEPSVQALQGVRLYFRFRTWQGQTTEQFPNPRINHDWRGLVEYMPKEGGGEIVDNTVEEGTEEEEEEETEETEVEERSLKELAAKADDGDADAANALADRAKAVGFNHEEFATWMGLAEAMEGDEDPDDTLVPAKGEVWFYTMLGKKKPIEVEIVAVFPKSQSANVKDLDTGKIMKAVSWDRLSTP